MQGKKYGGIVEAKRVSELEFIRKHLAQFLEQERSTRGVTIKDFAELTETPRTSLNRMLNGRHVMLDSYFLVLQKLGIPFKVTTELPGSEAPNSLAQDGVAKTVLIQEISRLVNEFVSEISESRPGCVRCLREESRDRKIGLPAPNRRR